MISRERFEEAYNKHWTKLWLFARRIVKDDEMAKDIVHDAFIKSWNKLDDVEDIDGYLWRTIYSISLDYLRVKTNRIFIEADEYKYDLPDETTIANYQIESSVINVFFEEIEHLPGKCKLIFLLSLKGFHTQEIMAKMGISQQNVLNQKQRAIHLLRLSMSKYSIV